jgi:hypothetical protein
MEDSLRFGKYKDWAVEDVIDHDPGYLEWAIENNVIELDSDAYETLQIEVRSREE